jgi:signal transduction histidine kinase
MDWWRALPERLRDAVGATPIVLVFVFAQQVPDGGPIPRAIAVVVIMGLALTFRRRYPLPAFVAALLTVALATTGMEFMAITSYTLVAHRPWARPAPVVAAALVAATVGYLQYWPEFVLAEVSGDLILIAAIGVLPPILGSAVRSSRRTTAELQQRNAELVALREQAAAHAVEAERFRIARELHDVVAHHVSAMTVRARAGRHVATREPQAAEEALAYIAEAGTETLTAMGSLVGALRSRHAVTAHDGLAPQPGLDDLADLLESFRGTGLVVHDEVTATGTAVSSSLGLNAYRIVQEALTNAIRHGAAERAWVAVWTEGDALRVQVDDNGRGIDDSPSGHGLIGVAERAALHGGASSFGPSPRGGCRLSATLPLAPVETTDLRALPLPTADA